MVKSWAFEEFETRSSKVLGESGQKFTPLPHWVNPELIKKGQEFIRRHLFSVVFSHFVSLLLLLAYGPIRRILIITNKSSSKETSRARYLSTLVHIKTWYEGDLLDPSSPASQDVYKIRKIHNGVPRTLTRNLEASKNTFVQIDLNDEVKEKFNIVENLKGDLKDVLPSLFFLQNGSISRGFKRKYFPRDSSNIHQITQLDMAVTQFCFMGLMALFPNAMGIHDEEGIEGFFHIWALIGFYLGINDDFNVGLQRNSWLRKEILYRRLLTDVYTAEKETENLWKYLVSGIATFIPFLSLKAVLLFVLRDVLRLDLIADSCGKRLKSCFGFYDSLCYKLMVWCFHSWTKLVIIHITFNWILRCGIFVASRLFIKENGPKVSATSEKNVFKPSSYSNIIITI